MQVFFHLERWTGVNFPSRPLMATSRVGGHALCKFKIFRPSGRTYREIRKEVGMYVLPNFDPVLTINI